MDKELKTLRKHILKSMRTHLGKRIIFAQGLPYIKKMNKYNKSNNNDLNIIISVSHNSKIDINDTDNLIHHLLNIRTFSDFNIVVKLKTQCIEFSLNEERVFKLFIFKGVNFASEKLVGYHTENGIKYTWVDIIDYEKHPLTVLNTYTAKYHFVLQHLIENNIEVNNEIDWTSFIENFFNPSYLRNDNFETRSNVIK